MTAALLAATPAVPLLLLAALAFGRLRARAVALIWAAPLPGLACAFLAADGAPLLADQRLRLMLALDGPSATLLGGVALLWCAAGVYAHAYLAPAGRVRFAAWWLATMAGSLGVFVAGDLVSFYLAYALASLPAWGLVIHDRTARAWRAGALYILLTVVGEAALLAAFALLAALGPNESLAIADVLPALATSPLRDVTIALLVAGFGLKAGLVPLHVWLPLAHPAAPMPASAVLSGAIIKAGILGLIRFLPPGDAPRGWGLVLAALGFVTAFWGVAVGVTQRNPKTVLAYSSISQMGVAVAAFGLGLAAGVAAMPAAVAFYALHHVLAKGALFLAVGVGAPRALVVAPALVLALGFGGLPPTGGWLAKEAVKPFFAGDPVALLSALSAAGSTALMLHFTRLLATNGAAPAGGRALVAPWLAMAAAALLLPWAVFPGDPRALLGPATLWAATWPVLGGVVLFAALLRWGDRLPEVPGGDILGLARPALAAAAPFGAALARLEAALRAWPVAGLALLALTLTLGLALSGAMR